MKYPIIGFHLIHIEKIRKKNLLHLLLAITCTQHCSSPPYFLSIKLKKKQQILLDIFLETKTSFLSIKLIKLKEKQQIMLDIFFEKQSTYAPMNAYPTPIRTSERLGRHILRLTKSPRAPHCWWIRRLPLKKISSLGLEPEWESSTTRKLTSWATFTSQ
jgi:hypothetical protein